MHVHINKYNADNMDAIIDNDNLCVTNGAHQADNKSQAISAIHCIVDEEASDDRADKCYVSNCCHCNGRRRMIPLQTTMTDEHCKCFVIYIHIYVEIIWRYLHCIEMIIRTLRKIL